MRQRRLVVHAHLNPTSRTIVVFREVLNPAPYSIGANRRDLGLLATFRAESLTSR